jgi:putative hydrolase of the HAD superfamily
MRRIEARGTAMYYDTFLFDLDNTLYPSSAGVDAALHVRMNAFVKRVVGCDDETAAALRHAYFLKHGTTLRGLQSEYSFDVEDYLEFVHDLALEELLAADAELDALLEQVPARKAIFTNASSQHAERVLRQLGIARHFDRIFDIRYAQFQPKPHPDAYQRILAELGASPARTVLIEDSARNLPPARALGIATVFIGEPLPGAAPPADLVAPDVRTALRVLLNGTT